MVTLTGGISTDAQASAPLQGGVSVSEPADAAPPSSDPVSTCSIGQLPFLPAPGKSSGAPSSTGPKSSDPTKEPLIAKSPTLKGQIDALEKAGWKIVFWPGPGNQTDSALKTIQIDKKLQSDPNSLVQNLAHEVGHALYKGKIDTSSRAAYIKSNLASEGAATMNNITAQREIVKNGGPDIGIAGDSANAKGYNAAYDQYLKDHDAAKAGDAMGSVYGSGEHTSTDGKSYNDYYGDYYDKNFAKKSHP